MTRAYHSVRFHVKNAWFNLAEQFSDLAGGIAGFLLFPFFIWLIARLWERFNSFQGHYTFHEIMLYIGVTEILFMTFLRGASLTRASSDFSLSLARPRSWLATSFSGLYGRCLGSRLIFLGVFFVVMPTLGVAPAEVGRVIARLFVLLPVLGVLQAFIGLLFASAHVLWEETTYFVLPVSKIFLALGGVFGPLIDYGEPWRSTLLKLPPSDLFFQPAHFCVKGEFYQMTPGMWIFRVFSFGFALLICNAIIYRYARKNHQSWGG